MNERGLRPYEVVGRNDLLNWVIIGCESNGKKAGRLLCDPHKGSSDNPELDEMLWHAAADSLVLQCAEAGVACFLKQLPILGMVSHDPSEWPTVLQVRQMPGMAGGA